MNCAKCGNALTAPPRELPDGLPGMLYRVCGCCGYTAVVRGRAPRRLDPRRFSRGSGVFVCGICGKRTRHTGDSDATNCGLCAPCYEASTLENAHADGAHAPGSVDGCPACREYRARALAGE